MKLKDSFISLVKGGILGLSSLVPGISIGSNLIALDVFNHVLEALNNLFKKGNRKLFLVVIPLVIGVLAGVLAGSRLVFYFLDNYKMPTIFLFIGILAGAFRLVLKKESGFLTGRNIFVFLGGGIFLFLLQFLVINNLDFSNFNAILTAILGGVLGGFLVFVPGLSGLKELFTNVFSLDNILAIIVFILILIIAIILLAKFIYYLIGKYKNLSYLVLLGGISSSIVILILEIGKFTISFVNIFTSILTFLWGYILIKNLEKEWYISHFFIFGKNC